MLGRCGGAWTPHTLPVARRKGRGKETRPAVLGTSWDEWSQWCNRLPPKDTEVVARGNKSEGFAKEVHRRHPPLG
jgi:hypothetical protein